MKKTTITIEEIDNMTDEEVLAAYKKYQDGLPEPPKLVSPILSVVSPSEIRGRFKAVVERGDLT